MNKTEEKRTKRSALKTVHADFAVLAAGRKAAITQADAGNRAGVTGECALTFACSRVPDLNHPIFSPGDDPKGVGTQGPHALQVAEEGAKTPTRGSLPQADGRIQSTSDHVSGWRRTSVVERRSERGGLEAAHVRLQA